MALRGRKMQSNGIALRDIARYPLRRVVGYEYDASGLVLLRETLECGHKQAPRQDFIGETNANRRRCRRCEPTRPSGEGATG